MEFIPFWNGSSIARTFDFNRVEEYCDCSYGYQLALLDNQMNHPEYENPFAKMSDDEILECLNEGSKDFRSIDAEFNL